MSATPTIAVTQKQNRGVYAADTANAGCRVCFVSRAVWSSFGNLSAARLNGWNSGSGMVLAGRRYPFFRTNKAITSPSIFLPFFSFSQHPGLVAPITERFPECPEILTERKNQSRLGLTSLDCLKNRFLLIGVARPLQHI
jgi:hypothetical protein